jgi:xylulokinase
MNPSEIRLTGGGSNSRLWRKMCADIFGVPTVCLQSGEGAGLGGAVQAGWVWNKEHGSDATLAEISDRLIQLDESSRNEPDPAATALYADALGRTSAILKALHEPKLI